MQLIKNAVLLIVDLKTDSLLRHKLAIYNNTEFGLQHFMYNNSLLTENIFQHLSRTNFRGIVVRLSVRIAL